MLSSLVSFYLEGIPINLNITKLPKIDPSSVKGVQIKKIRNEVPDFPGNVLTSNCYTPFAMDSSVPGIVREKSIYYKFPNVYFNDVEIFQKNQMINHKYRHIPEMGEYRFSHTVLDRVVYLLCTYEQYGHVVHDGMLTALFNIPWDVIRNSTLVIRRNLKIAKKAIDHLEIPYGNYLFMEPNTTYFCRELHMVSPNYQCGSQQYSTLYVRDYVYKHFNLTGIKPINGLMFNRKLTSRGRHIENFNEFRIEIPKRYPNINWIDINDKQLTNYSYSLKILAATKYFFSVSGSACYNIMYMQPYTGIAVIGSDIYDWLPMTNSVAWKIWYAYAVNPHIPHFPSETQLSFNVSVEYNLKYLDKLIYAVDHQRWPKLEDNSMAIVFDTKTMRDIVKIDDDVDFRMTKGLNTIRLVYESYQPKNYSSMFNEIINIQ
ncbi:hypothetical protein TVAG_469270 [Trichomonas vaginalis G3]|uniref:Glycosyltransferase 61 catalytic domain-containing protein n=1 Tax=Trichomonas vaginalis (strain ATCC PRA-98 / G3) TaxID=412133 RepID=A2G4X6_TRIV3|nr:glycosyltransferase family [Trichomonas vaginalis G3]EAX87792.1 hypothetical protein TVAG_469270 [Trichomonas vaginalis G3]KAI5536933.1 glycosyltransferase family [Trichomonas vaginalis G3]|eukprot:XP_001300722.1 hypothetical protein [Trichomonas vaginalis G3]